MVEITKVSENLLAQTKKVKHLEIFWNGTVSQRYLIIISKLSKHIHRQKLFDWLVNMYR